VRVDRIARDELLEQRPVEIAGNAVIDPTQRPSGAGCRMSAARPAARHCGSMSSRSSSRALRRCRRCGLVRGHDPGEGLGNAEHAHLVEPADGGMIEHECLSMTIERAPMLAWLSPRRLGRAWRPGDQSCSR
jgi:hypothetical protein